MFIAEREGFEPPEPFSSTVFKTAVIDHSTTSPIPSGHWFVMKDCKSKEKIRKSQILLKNLAENIWRYCVYLHTGPHIRARK